jgi:adenosine deaminase
VSDIAAFIRRLPKAELHLHLVPLSHLAGYWAGDLFSL